jgi:AraC-like DNA-binding protein
MVQGRRSLLTTIKLDRRDFDAAPGRWPICRSAWPVKRPVDSRISLIVEANAVAAGFGDPSCFHRVFRRRFGATPSDVRVDLVDLSSARAHSYQANS